MSCTRCKKTYTNDKFILCECGKKVCIECIYCGTSTCIESRLASIKLKQCINYPICQHLFDSNEMSICKCQSNSTMYHCEPYKEFQSKDKVRKLCYNCYHSLKMKCIQCGSIYKGYSRYHELCTSCISKLVDQHQNRCLISHLGETHQEECNNCSHFGIGTCLSIEEKMFIFSQCHIHKNYLCSMGCNQLGNYKYLKSIKHSENFIFCKQCITNKICKLCI